MGLVCDFVLIKQSRLELVFDLNTVSVIQKLHDFVEWMHMYICDDLYICLYVHVYI